MDGRPDLPPTPSTDPHKMGPSHLDVLLDHPEFVVINKPAGIPVIPERFDTSGDDLHTIVKVRFGDSMMVVHRIDRETSGIVLFARSAEAHRHLSLQFQENKVRKTYLALVVGAPLWDERTVDLPLRADGDRRHRTLEIGRASCRERVWEWGVGGGRGETWGRKRRATGGHEE